MILHQTDARGLSLIHISAIYMLVPGKQAQEMNSFRSIPICLLYTSMAGSIAAVVRGFSQHPPGLNIAGVIATGVGSAAHAALLRRALDHHRMPPLVAAFPKNAKWTRPERQLGLVPAEEEARQRWV